MDMLEKERQRIARELHDSTIQEMVHVIHVLELAQKFSAQDPIRGKMELLSASKEIRNTIENIRKVIFDLRPMLLDDLGYTETLNRLKFHLENISDMKVELSIEDISIENTMNGLVLYRIIQECCINAIKHSQGTKVSVSLHCKEDMVSLRIVDNGIGFDMDGLETPNTNSFGLEMTKERVNLLEGTMEVESEKEIGTVIYISFSKNKLMN
jgi:two-component system sensor histidine kinase DegS